MNIRVCVPAQVGAKTVEEAAAQDGENCIYYAVPITAMCCLKFWKLPGQVTQDLLEGVLMVVTTKKPEMKCECQHITSEHKVIKMKISNHLLEKGSFTDKSINQYIYLYCIVILA